MKGILKYTIDFVYMKEKGDCLADVVKKWLDGWGVDSLVYAIVLGEYATLVVDYSFDEVTPSKKVIELVDVILKRFNITYDLQSE